MSERWTHPEEGRFVRRPKLRQYDKKGKNYCMNNVNSLNCYKASYWKYKQIFVLDALIYVSVRSNKLLVCYVKKRNMAGYLCLFNILMIETFFSALCPWVITSISLFISLVFFFIILLFDAIYYFGTLSYSLPEFCVCNRNDVG